MGNEQYISERIEKYLNQQLSDAESLEMEKEIETNPEIADEFQSQLMVHYGIWREAHLAQKSQLKKRFPSQVAAYNRRRSIRLWISGAAILLILMVSAIFIFSNKTLTPEEQFVAYFNPLPAPESKSAASLSFFEQGNRAYNQQNYVQAIDLYKKSGTEGEAHKPGERAKYLALSYLAMGQASEAIVVFQDIQPQTETIEWYLALAYIKNNQLLEARQLIEKISTDKEHHYHSHATEILKSF